MAIRAATRPASLRATTTTLTDGNAAQAGGQRPGRARTRASNVTSSGYPTKVYPTSKTLPQRRAWTAITETVTKGRNMNVSEGTLAMPSFKDTLGAERIHLVAAYVWSLSNKGAAK